MDTFLCLFSDRIWLPLLEFLIVALFILAVLHDFRAYLRPANPLAEVKRGEKSWTILLSFWAIAIITVRRLGLQGVRFHDLRHTHATLMLKEGIHPKIVSERLGHSTIGITLDTYSHVTPGLQEAAALKFEQCLRK